VPTEIHSYRLPRGDHLLKLLKTPVDHESHLNLNANMVILSQLQCRRGKGTRSNPKRILRHLNEAGISQRPTCNILTPEDDQPHHVRNLDLRRRRPSQSSQTPGQAQVARQVHAELRTHNRTSMFRPPLVAMLLEDHKRQR
jgi:hypothetical protein